MQPAWRAFFQTIAADTEINLGDYEAAARWAEAATRNCADAGRGLWVLGSALTKLTAALHMLGRTELALKAALRAREQFRIPEFAGQAMADGWTVELAPAFYAAGRPDIAGEVLRQGGLAMRRNGVDLAPNQFLEVAGIVEFLRGEPALCRASVGRRAIGRWCRQGSDGFSNAGSDGALSPLLTPRALLARTPRTRVACAARDEQ